MRIESLMTDLRPVLPVNSNENLINENRKVSSVRGRQLKYESRISLMRIESRRAVGIQGSSQSIQNLINENRKRISWRRQRMTMRYS